MEILNSTISGNRLLGKGREAFNGAGITNDSFLSIEFSSIVNNAGSGIASGSGASSRIAYSILAGNRAAYSPGSDIEPYDCYGPLRSGGYNIIGVDDRRGECDLRATVSDQVGSDRTAPINPSLGPLANNGGPTATHKLLADSPAIGKVPADNCPAIDQRDILRPRGRDAYCDIGAYEASPCDNLPLLCVSLERLVNLCAINPFLCQKNAVPKINEIFALIGSPVPVLRNNIIQNTAKKTVN